MRQAVGRIVRRNVRLPGVTVRPIHDRAESSEWNRLMDVHHHLGFRCLFGGGVRHIAEDEEGRWVALVGWGAGSLKVKVRDDWIGWVPQRQYRRLHLIASNSRFLVIPPVRQANLASRVLSLSTRRLPMDMVAFRGHPVLLAETFVEPRFRGTCYLAANWTALGETKGYARARDGWVKHGIRKRIFVRALVPHARRILRGPDEPDGVRAAASRPFPPPSPTHLRALYDYVSAEFCDDRSPRGLRHRATTLAAIAVAARLAGAEGVNATSAFSSRFSQRQLAAVRAFHSPTTASLLPPSKSTLRRFLSELHQDTLDDLVHDWLAASRH